MVLDISQLLWKYMTKMLQKVLNWHILFGTTLQKLINLLAFRIYSIPSLPVRIAFKFQQSIVSR